MVNIRKRRKTATRHYDSSRRQAGARETRLQIADAARRLFLERGYAGATIEAIAEKGNVATETVYAAFRSKRNLLAFVLDVSMAGDDEPIPIIERPEPQAVLRSTDPRKLLHGFALDITEILARAAAVFEVTRIAGKTEPEIAARVEALSRERLENMRRVAQRLAAIGPLRNGVDVESAAQVLWAITSQDMFLLTTRYLGWTKETYGEWTTETLIRLLLP